MSSPARWAGRPPGTIRSRVSRARGDLDAMTGSGQAAPPRTPASGGARRRVRNCGQRGGRSFHRVPPGVS